MGWTSSDASVATCSDRVAAKLAHAPVIQHRLRSAHSGPVYSCYVPGGLTSLASYVVMVWVWLPEDFAGRAVELGFDGYSTTAAGPIDLTLRGAWQLAWSAATIPEGAQNAQLALSVDGPGGTTLFTTGERLVAGTEPNGAEPIRLEPEPHALGEPEGSGRPADQPPHRSIFDTDVPRTQALPGDVGTGGDLLVLGELSQFLPGGQNAWQAGELGIAHVTIVAPAGRYTRRAVYDVDFTDAEPATQAAAKAYFDHRTTEYGPSHLVRLAGAVVAGEGTVVVGGKIILLDSMREYIAYGRKLDGFDAIKPKTLFRLERPPSRVIDGPTLLIGRPFYANFGHWLVEGAAQIALLAPHVGHGWKIAVSRQPSAAMHRVVDATIRAALPGRDVTILERDDREAWGFEELYYGSPVHVPPLFKHPVGMGRLAESILPHLAPGSRPAPTPCDRMYISRQNAGHRRLVNEDELIPILEKFGFVTILPEQYSFAEQVSLFRSAKVVIGAKGAALTGLAFSNPDAIAIMLSPADNPDPFFWDLAGMRGMRYAELFGPVVNACATPGFNDFSIDPARLELMLSIVLRRR